MRRLAIGLGAAALLGVVTLGTGVNAGPTNPRTFNLPYRAAGLDERAAAAFLLDRLTFGARPGEVDRVVEMGLEQWLDQQLTGALPEPELDGRLAQYEALGMTDAQLIARYPNSSQLSAHVRRFHEGLIPGRDEPILDFSVVTAKLDAYRAERGILSQDKELREQVLGQKVVRAVFAQNQLREVLTDFWQNHFFTSPLSFNARVWVLPYERDVVRPNALGNFRQLLGASAKHPAILQYYVGSALPMTLAAQSTTMGMNIAALRQNGTADVDRLVAAVEDELGSLAFEEDLVLAQRFWSATGPNEPYARSLIELQTLGPDAGATPSDISAAARIFTGWSTTPIGPSDEWFKKGLARAAEVGFVQDGRFLFRADQHDATAKRVFGQEFAAGGGVDEGERVLDYLAAQPSTARHIGRKLAVRFVSETPSDALVERLAAAFESSAGDLTAVMQALVEAPEFWAAAAQREKIKNPLEYAASALRATAADLTATAALTERIAQMGQPLYAYMEPTGFPDSNSYWLDSASLLSRINFAQDLTANRIAGVTFDPAGLDSAAPASAVSEATAMTIAGPQFQLR